MGLKFAPFKYSIGEVVTTYNRQLQLIDAEYRTIEKIKNNKKYNSNRKWYKYRCLKCGNEDWIYEACLQDTTHTGCNACCSSPKKIVRGVNDISTTAPWLVKYFVNTSDIYENAKYSKKIVEMKCPDCGRVFNKQINQVTSNGGLSCSCSDKWSFPNKFMYALLEQLGVSFEIEKRFKWSDGRVYDDYIEYNGLKIITEQHGVQHYERAIAKFNRHRSLQEEKLNDVYKYNLAMNNGIDYYFVINSSVSSLDHMRKSITDSGLLEVLQVSSNTVDWKKCAEFATSNFAKKICEFKNTNPKITLHQIAKIFRVSYETVLGYVKVGNKFGWCDYKFDDIKLNYSENLRIVNQKPIYCQNTNTYYRNSNLVAEYLSTDQEEFSPRQIRRSIQREGQYRGKKFNYITQEEFNKIKMESPDKVVGDFFIL